MKEEGRRREEGGRGRGKREEAGEVGEKKEGGRREGEAGSNFFFYKTHISRFSQQQLGIGIGLQKWNQSMPT